VPLEPRDLPPQISTGWTTTTLMEYYKDRHIDLQAQMAQRFDSQQRALEAAISAQGKAIDAALTAVTLASNKAERAMELRFESVNEFRQQLSDQTATFMTRDEINSTGLRYAEQVRVLTDRVSFHISRDEAMGAIDRNAERIQELIKRMDRFIDRDAVMAQYNIVMTKVDEIAKAQTLSSGNRSGMHASWAFAGAVITILIAIVALYINYHK